MSTPLEINQAGDGYAWPSDTWDAVWASVNTEPGSLLYPHYFGRACANLAWPFQEKPIVTAFLDAYSAAVTTVESSAWQVRDSGLLDTAEGDALRIAAALVRAPWSSEWADSTARTVILFTADALAVDYGWESILAATERLWSGQAITLNEGANVHLWLWGADAAVDDLGHFAQREMVRGLFPAGIGTTINSTPSATPLFFSDAADMPSPGAMVGFGDAAAMGSEPVAFNAES